MGTTTDAYIAWGIALEEGAELPWDDYDDHEDWWREVNGYVPLHSPYTPDGREYAEGFSESDPRIDEQYEHAREWLAENPMPFEPENTCSSDYPMWFLAAPGSINRASRGNPVRFEPGHLAVDDGACQRLLAFCAEYGIEDDSAGWHLFSYWG